MDGMRTAAAGLLVLSLTLAYANPLRAGPPPVASPAAAAPGSAEPPAQAAKAEPGARGPGSAEEQYQQMLRQLNPAAYDARRAMDEYARTLAAREAQRRQRIEAAFDDGPELDMRQALRQRAQKLFAARDFAQLDRFYDDFALQGARTPSGLWKSGFWLSGLGVDAASDEAYRAHDELLQQWLRERPQSALARLLRARLMVRRAWAFRGGGYASTVDERNWRPFFDWLAKAQDYLDAEKAVVSARPEYYELAIDVLLYRQKSPFATFDEGLEKFPAYYPMYFAMMEYLLPKWHGGIDQIEHFAAEAVARTRQSEGRAMYARIYWAAAQGQFRDNLFAQSKANWPRMRDGFEDMIARYPDQWNLQNYASFACDANDEQTLAKLFERIREPSLDAAWRSRDRYVACGRRVGKFKD